MWPVVFIHIEGQDKGIEKMFYTTFLPKFEEELFFKLKLFKYSYEIQSLNVLHGVREDLQDNYNGEYISP
jgi:hypothetical protein